MTQMSLFTPAVRRLLADPFFGPFDLPSTFAGTPDPSYAPTSWPNWAPPVDVLETDRELRLEVELPGVSRDDVSVRFHDGRLTIEGRRGRRVQATDTPEASRNGNVEASPDRSLEVRTSDARWAHRERHHGTFRRTFSLPDTVDASAIRAETSDGILTVVLPKLEKAQPRQIEVQVS